MRRPCKQIGKGATTFQHASFQELFSWPVGVCLFKKRERHVQVRRYRVEHALIDVVLLLDESFGCVVCALACLWYILHALCCEGVELQR